MNDWLREGSKIRIFDRAVGRIRHVELYDLEFTIEDCVLKLRCSYKFLGEGDVYETQLGVTAAELSNMIKLAEKMDKVYELAPGLKEVLKGYRIATVYDYTVINLQLDGVCPECTGGSVEVSPSGEVVCMQCRSVIVHRNQNNTER